MVATDDEVRRTKVFSDNCMPHCLAGTCHAHGEREERKVTHAIWVLGHDSFVYADAGIVIDISWLGKTNDGVDEDVRLTLASSTDGKLTVSTVHWIPCLESHDSAPCKFFEVGTEFSGGVCRCLISETCTRVTGTTYIGEQHNRNVRVLVWLAHFLLRRKA